MHPKDADGMANSIDPDQLLLQKQSGLGLHCLLRPICPNTIEFVRYLILAILMVKKKTAKV